VWLVGLALFGAIVSGLLIAGMNIRFGKDDPAAALLEGAEFLQFHQMQAKATKGNMQSEELPFAIPTQSPVVLPGAETHELPGKTESD